MILTLKSEGIRGLLVSLLRRAFHRDLTIFLDWYNEHRPHTGLFGATPDEIYHARRPANRRPRCEPRPHWPRAAPCAKPRTLVAGQPGDSFEFTMQFADRRRRLPIVSLNRAA